MNKTELIDGVVKTAKEFYKASADKVVTFDEFKQVFDCVFSGVVKGFELESPEMLKFKKLFDALYTGVSEAFELSDKPIVKL
jgi:hypothetical protein